MSWMGLNLFFGNKQSITTTDSGSIIINGKTYVGNDITIVNNKVIIDGVDVTPDSKQITINVEGNVESIKADVVTKITVAGNVGGDLNCGTGDVQVNNGVNGYVKTGVGDVKISGNVGGNVKTGVGDIKYYK